MGAASPKTFFDFDRAHFQEDLGRRVVRLRTTHLTSTYWVALFGGVDGFVNVGMQAVDIDTFDFGSTLTSVLWIILFGLGFVGCIKAGGCKILAAGLDALVPFIQNLGGLVRGRRHNQSLARLTGTRENLDVGYSNSDVID